MYSFDGESLVDERRTTYEHYGGQLGVYEKSPFIVGGTDTSFNIEVEHYKSNWTYLGDFPFAKRYILNYSTVTIANELYLFGERGLFMGPVHFAE